MDKIHASYLAKIGVPQHEIDDIMSFDIPKEEVFSLEKALEDDLFNTEGEF